MPSSSVATVTVEKASGTMIKGLRIAIRGAVLNQRIAERITAYEAEASALDARISQRAGDLPFDVRAEDGFRTLGELQSERQHIRERLSQLTLVRDGLIADELYALSGADLRLVEIISTGRVDARSASDEGSFDEGTVGDVDGLKLKMSGDAVRTLLTQRIQEHQRRVERWDHERTRTPEQQTDDEPLLPEHICENEAERHRWRVDVLTFIRDHVDAAETYRLGEADLNFGELLPEKPWWLEQEEYEERNGGRFHLERLAKHARALSTEPSTLTSS